MGTETSVCVFVYYDIHCNVVKLNNPLMGTETSVLLILIAKLIAKVLN